MGISVVPDWGEAVGKALSGLGERLAGSKDPYLDFHTKLREAMATNPEILEKLAGHAYLNEGSLGPAERLLPKDVLQQARARASSGQVMPEFIKQKAGRDVVHATKPEELKPPGGYTQREWW